MKILPFALIAGSLTAADSPSAEISNGVVTAKLYLPDAKDGYYRGTRFDWSGQVYSLRTLGHEFFGQWFDKDKYDPNLHDAIMGPVEAFHTGDSSLGYEETPVGGTFYRIGVGALKRPDDTKFQAFRKYEVIDPGKWTVTAGRDSIQFVQNLSGPHGYAWRYTKTIRLVEDKPEMAIEHSLRNTGTKPIVTEQYNHNFFVIDGKPTGPGVTAKFPFDLRPIRPFTGGTANVNGGTISYPRELEKGQSAYGQFEGASTYDIRLEHEGAGAGVHISGDRPIRKLVYWSIQTTFCPEAYIDVGAAPGEESHWTYTYSYYSLPRKTE